MITLCGFAVSNYYNKVKLALLEKNIAFTESYFTPSSTNEELLAGSPLGKVPFIRTAQGTLCESQVIMDYLEATFPQPALIPSDPFAAAKVRELITFTELHLELVGRELYAQAFFGGTVSESTKARVRKQLEKNITAFKRLVKFSPFIAGEHFSQADCSAYATLPVLGMATKSVLGEDLLQAMGIDYKPYLALLGERASVQKVAADRKAAATQSR